jgi:hypothetical protein
MKSIHQRPVDLGSPFAVACSPSGDRDEEVISALKAAGIRQTLVRVPSWDRPGLPRLASFIGRLRGEGLDVVAAVLQNRNDVLNPAGWESFLDETFSALAGLCSYFEVGHAWNRTKWGVWDYREYINLARAAASLAPKYRAKLVGPAVIDFEFHLYPPTLRAVGFDKISSLLYVDRTGAPENAQFGWTTTKKLALWRAVVNSSIAGPRECWITEFNWPLAGTGQYSPAPGKPSVTEEEQASYLVRYFVICATTGFVERIYWWQLAAPGYGLIDNREKPWRKRPSYLALHNLIRRLEGSRFEGKVEDRQAEIYQFRRGGEKFVVCWKIKGEADYSFPEAVRAVIGRDGEEKAAGVGSLRIEERPQYVFFG